MYVKNDINTRLLYQEINNSEASLAETFSWIKEIGTVAIFQLQQIMH